MSSTQSSINGEGAATITTNGASSENHNDSNPDGGYEGLDLQSLSHPESPVTQFAAPPDSSEFELDDEPLHGPGPQGEEELDSPLHNNLSGGYPPSPSGTSLTENPVRAALGLLIKETPVSTSHSIGLDEFSVPALRQLTACELIERVIGLGSSASQILYGGEKPLIAFVSPIGTSLGTSIVSFLVEWGLYPHKDCASGLSDQPSWKNLSSGPFDYRGYIRAFKTASIHPSLQLLVWVHVLPKSITNALRDRVLSFLEVNGPGLDLSTGAYGPSCEASVFNCRRGLLAWGCINNTDVNQSGAAFLRWSASLNSVNDWIFQEVTTQFAAWEETDAIYCLRQYACCERRHKRWTWTDSVDEESRLYSLLSEAHKVHIPWCVRRSLLVALVQSRPRAEKSDLAFSNLISELMEAPEYPTFLNALSIAAKKAQAESVDNFLGTHPPKRKSSTEGAAANQTPAKKPRETATRSDSRKTYSGSWNYKADYNYYGNKNKPYWSNNYNKNYWYGNKAWHSKKYHASTVAETTNKKHQNPTNDSSTTTVTNLTSNYLQGEFVLSISDSEHEILVKPGVVSNPRVCNPTKCNIGFDTLAAVNCITSAAAQQANLSRKNKNEPQHLSGIGSTLVTAYVDATVSYNGHTATIPLDIVDSLPCNIDIVISFADLSRFGITIHQSCSTATNCGGPAATESQQINACKTFMQDLANTEDSWHALPGAKNYRSRLRRTTEQDKLDTPNQIYVYEIDWQDPLAQNHRKHKVRDYSTALLKDLTPAQRKSFEDELQMYLDKGWWNKPNDSTTNQSSEFDYPPAVTFPVCQGDYKTTKVRPCSDGREMNSYLPKGGYNGHSIQDIVDIVRCRWRSSYKMIFMDLSKAFYRCRLRRGRKVKIISMGQSFESDRVLFGGTYGPAALNGAVLILLNAIFSALTGHTVNAKSTREFLSLVDGLSVMVYYDDFCVFGLPHLVDRFKTIATVIAPLIGMDFPENKTDVIESNPIRHLGVNWYKQDSGTLTIQCIPPESPPPLAKDSVSKREVSSYAGLFYDPLRTHGDLRLYSDWLRSWIGKLPGNKRTDWDRQWKLTKDNQKKLTLIHDRMTHLAIPHTGHQSVPRTHTKIVVHCDASTYGYGWTIHTTQDKDSPLLPLVEYAIAFKPKEAAAWHVNRKEMFCLTKAASTAADFAKHFCRNQLTTIDIYSDNQCAVAWANSLAPNMRSFDVTAVTRLCANLQEIIDMLKEDYHITTAIHHIDGTNNTRADYLSRLVYNIPQLSIPTETHKTNYSRNSQLQLGHVHSIKDDHAIHNMTPSGPTTLGALVLIPEQQCCDPCLILTPNPQTANPNPPPEGTDAVRSVESFAPSVTTPEPTDGLCGICDMGEEDALDEIRDFYRTNGEEHSDLQLLGIPIEKVVKAAQGKISDQSAERLLGGTARGEQIEWTSDVLQFKDYYRGQQRARVLLPTKRLQTWALYHYHDDALTGSHRGASKCIEKISSAGFWWPNMSRETQQFTATCEMCQKGKVTSPTIAPVLLRRRSGARFANIQIDFIGPLGNEDRSPGNWQYMGVIIDQGTRAAMALPCWDMTVRSAIMCLLIWISTYGRPDSCQSDNGPAFASDEWSDFLDAYHIRKRFGTPGVPRHQGSVERVNREIKDAIHVGEAVRDERRMPWWATAILAIGVHNSSPLRDLPTSTPSELALGSDHATLLRGIEDASFTKDSPAETITLDRWQSLYEHINTIYGLYTHLRDERSVIEEYRSLLSAGQRDLTVFQPGDQVLLVGLNHKGSRVVIGEYSIISRAPHNRFMYYLEGLKGLYPTSRLVPRKINPIRAILDSEAKPQRSSLARALGSPPPESIRFPDLTAGDWLICEWRYAPRMTDDDSERPFWQYFVCEVSPHQRGLDRSTTIRVVGLDLSPRTNRWLLTKGKEKQIWQIKKDEFFVGFKPTKSRRIPASITKWLEARGLNLD